MILAASSQLMRANFPLPRSPTRFIGYRRRFGVRKGPAVASAAQAGANLRVVVGVVGADLQRAAFGDGDVDLAFAAAVVDASAVDDVRLLDRKRRLRFDFGHVPQKRARFVVIRELRIAPGQKRLEKLQHLDGLATLPVAAQGLRIHMDGIGQEPILEKCRRVQISFVQAARVKKCASASSCEPM